MNKGLNIVFAVLLYLAYLVNKKPGRNQYYNSFFGSQD